MKQISFTIWFLFISQFLLAQNIIWSQHINHTDYSAGVAMDSHGNTFYYGKFSCPQTDINAKCSIDFGGHIITDTSGKSYIVKYDINGNVIWSKILRKETITCMVISNSGRIFFSGYTSFGTSAKTSVTAIDENGNLIWRKQDNNNEGRSLGYGINLDENEDVYITGLFNSNLLIDGVQIDGISNLTKGGYLAKLKNNGSIEWVRRAETGYYDAYREGSGRSICVDKFGNIFIVGLTLNAQGGVIYNNSFIAMYDNNGARKWMKTYGNVFGSYHYGVSVNVDAIGNVYALLSGEKKNGIVRFNKFGQEVWFRGLPLHDDYSFLAVDKKGSTYLLTKIFQNFKYEKDDIVVSGNSDCVIFKHDSLGNYIWNHKIGNAWSETPYSFAYSDNGQFSLVISGTSLNFGKGTHSGFFIVNYYDTTYVPDKFNTIRGKIFQDVNSDCIDNPSELSLGGIVVKAEPGPYYGFSNANGEFTIRVDTGNYKISQIIPEGKGTISASCSNSYNVSFSSYENDTSGFHFGNHISACPHLTIDIASDRRRRCFRNVTTVSFCNEGFATASNVQVNVIYPKYVIPVSSTLAWNEKIDSLLIFNVGNLDPLQCGSFQIIDSVMCGDESIRGLIQCTKALISPYNTCSEISPLWDKSFVEIQGGCSDVGVSTVKIINTGEGWMADSSKYRIFLNSEKIYEGSFRLKSLDTLFLNVASSGKSLRVEADQSEGSPFNSRPTFILEGCGAHNATSFSKGFSKQMPYNDSDFYFEMSCLEIRDSYDPNDKQVFPSGITNNNFVSGEEELEYMIRFQNEGNDDAYKVLVLDVLDESLDLETFIPGITSHPCKVEISGKGRPVITWIFEDINLPAKITNEPLSHGYIKYKIKPKTGLTPGKRVYNKASIFFDYNSPIITNQVFNTISDTTVARWNPTLVNTCSGNTTYPLAGSDTLVCNSSSINLKANYAVEGIGRWRSLSGPRNILNPALNQTTSNLLAGMNSFEWSITSCKNIFRDTIDIDRKLSPVINSVSPYCSGDTIKPITATGSNIVWYSNNAITDIVGEGNTFLPVTNVTKTFYAVSQFENCRTSPTSINVVINPIPPVPTQNNFYYCKGSSSSLTASGSGTINWYADTNLTQFIRTGTFLTYIPVTDTAFYLQAVSFGCKSPIAKFVHLGQDPFNAEIYISGDSLFTNPGLRYIWYHDNKVIPNSDFIWHKPANSGKYKVVVMREACSSTSPEINFQITNISNLVWEGLSLYPNPASDKLIAEGNEMVGGVNMKIFDLLGNERKTIQLNNPDHSRNEIELEDLPEGFYLIKLEINGRNNIFKLHIER
ncbi:MAG: T9SS type A sorting domain-containing protein [Cytophagaceae bacterium]